MADENGLHGEDDLPVDAREAPSRRAFEDEALIDVLSTGVAYAAAGAVVGLSERSVRRRMTNPLFVAAVARRRGERLAEVTGQVSALAVRAVEVLEHALEDDNQAFRLRAAQMVLTLTRHLRTEVDNEARFLALEVKVGLVHDSEPDDE